MFIRKGDWSAAEKTALDSLSYGQRFNFSNTIWPFAIQLFLIRKDQGNLGSLEPWLKSFAEQNPGVSLISAAIGLALVDTERMNEAASLTLPLAANLDSIVRDQFRPVTMGMLAEITTALQDASTAGNLYDALFPWRDRQYVVAGGAIYGSASRHLGILAAVSERYDDAEMHFEEALAMNTRLCAPPWIARTQFDYARMLLKRDGRGDRERASGLLGAALATAQQIGMAKVAADCEQLLA